MNIFISLKRACEDEILINIDLMSPNCYFQVSYSILNKLNLI